MFTKESWERANGYPEFAGALDTWGFGFWQVATGSKMICMPDFYYFHRYGHESYWVRQAKKGNISLTALQIILPFLYLFNERDVDYIMSRRGRYTWFDNLGQRPIRLKTKEVGRTGSIVRFESSKVSLRSGIKTEVVKIAGKVLSVLKTRRW
jgi:hypothetical protein